MKLSDHPAVFVPPPLLAAVPFVVGVWVQRRWPWPIVEVSSRTLVGIGVSIIVAGAAIEIAAIATFARRGTTVLPALRPTTAIVTSGPYRFTRNPMYVAMSLMYLGLSAALNTAWPLLLFPAALIGIDRYVIRREERYLSSKFGEAYEAYRRQVPRWL